MSAAFDNAMPSQSVYAGQSVWNYTLYDPEDPNIQQSPPTSTRSCSAVDR